MLINKRALIMTDIEEARLLIQISITANIALLLLLAINVLV
jgi:hypothetical protein